MSALMAIKFIVCSVSMALTALFALSFGDSQPMSIVTWGVGNWLSAVLLVAVGLCIDGCKYLFWARRLDVRFFSSISLVLAVFSWLASIAFFESSQAQKVMDARKVSPAYAAYTLEVEALRQQIRYQEQLVAQQLGSRHHEQWRQGEVAMAKLVDQQSQLKELMHREVNAPNQFDTDTLISQQFFQSVAVLMGSQAQSVRIGFFAVLALLIEICALGAISLSSTETKVRKAKVNDQVSERRVTKPVDKAHRRRLIEDIRNGKIEPVLRKIKAARYGLSLDEIRVILKELEQQGHIERSIRNSYKLS